MGQPLRVLHVVVNMNRGGAETLIMNLYRNIDRTKVQFDFLTCKEGSFDKEILEMGGNIHRLPYITDVGHFTYLRDLKDFFRTHHQYGIVHAHMDKMSGFVLRAAQKAGVPMRISHSHNTSSEGGFLAKGYKWYVGQFVRQSATHRLACSEKASQWLFGNRSNQAVILKNGIDSTKFKHSVEAREQAREQLNVKDRFVVGHVGRFCHQKNHAFLVDIFTEINRLNPDSCLILAGDGPLRSDIEKKVKRIGLEERVKFLGVRTDIHEILQSFDIMLFPSVHEGLPVTLIEAQGVGVPCLVSSSITDEVDMGANLIKFESLSCSPQTWANQAILLNKGVKDTTSYIRHKGYDIRQSAASLQSFYLQMAAI